MILKNVKNGGYTKQDYIDVFGTPMCHVLLGAGLNVRKVYDNSTKKYTDDVESVRLQLYWPEAGADWVRFPADFDLESKKLEDYQEVELVNPTACIVKNKVYVKADDIKC
jgi:hypothetical protein